MDCRQRRPPLAPNVPLANLSEYNRAAQETYLTQSRNRCAHCLLRFEATTLVDHISRCKERGTRQPSERE